jgi:hypothetical protein
MPGFLTSRFCMASLDSPDLHVHPKAEYTTSLMLLFTGGYNSTHPIPL